MPIDTYRIRYLLGINARDIRTIDYYFERKLAAYFGLLYRELERGTPDERYYVYLLRRLRTTPERVESIRWKFPELTGTSRFYAAAVLAEWDARQAIAGFEFRVEEDVTPEELLDRAIILKETEEDFLTDLVAALRTRVPERPEWSDYVERILGFVRARLEELRKMVGIWAYKLRVSARVVRGHAPGSKHPYRPPRWVPLYGGGRPGRGEGPSPIFIELSFERFISSLDEPELETTYKPPLIDLIKRYMTAIERMLHIFHIEVDKWDFGIDEEREAVKEWDDPTSDFWVLNIYNPRDDAWEVASGYYSHPV